VTNKEFLQNSESVNYFSQRYDQHLAELGDDVTLYKEISTFFAQEFGKIVPEGSESLYSITSAFSEIHLNGFGFDALIYPSVVTKGSGNCLNVALKQEALTKINLEAVVMSHILFRGSSHKVFPNPIMECKSFDQNGMFRWERSNGSHNRETIMNYMG
jgi:hypothetical protein